MIKLGKCRIAVIGSGSRLPAAVGLAKHFDPKGFDLKTCRMTEVRTRRDSTPEVGAEGPPAATHLSFRKGLQELRTCHADSVTLPPPIGDYERPELSWLIGVSTTTGQALTQGDSVYESTFYPCCTEAICASTLERESSLKFNRYFMQNALRACRKETTRRGPEARLRGRSHRTRHRRFHRTLRVANL